MTPKSIWGSMQVKDRVASSSWLSSLGCFFRTRVFLLGLVIVLVVGLVFLGNFNQGGSRSGYKHP